MACSVHMCVCVHESKSLSIVCVPDKEHFPGSGQQLIQGLAFLWTMAGIGIMDRGGGGLGWLEHLKGAFMGSP